VRATRATDPITSTFDVALIFSVGLILNIVPHTEIPVRTVAVHSTLRQALLASFYLQLLIPFLWLFFRSVTGLRHPCIVTVMGAVWASAGTGGRRQLPQLVMELMENGLSRPVLPLPPMLLLLA
jgi:hypothetical protein